MNILTHKLSCLAAFPPDVMGNCNSVQLLCDYVTGYITYFIIHFYKSFLPTEKKNTVKHKYNVLLLCIKFLPSMCMRFVIKDRLQITNFTDYT